MITRKPAASTPSAGADASDEVPATHAAGGLPQRPSASDADVAAFIAKMKSVAPVATGEHGRLMFAMDATMSRAPTWDMALKLQGEMFAAVKEVGGLDVQLVSFRGA